MKNLFSLLIVLGTFVYGQDYRFGKVSKDDLSKTKSTIEPSASAEILYSYGKYAADWNNSTGDLELNKSIYYRIKIYDKDKVSQDILKHQVKLFRSNSDVEKLSGLKVVTYNLEGDKIVETKIDKKDIFTDKASKYHQLETFTFPNVKNGSVIEFSYEVTSPFYSSTDTWYFQESIPVVKSDFAFEGHEYLKYQPFNTGQFNPTSQKSETKSKTISYSTISRYVRNTGASMSEYKYNTEVKYISYSNLPAFDREAYVLNRRNLLSSIRYELSAYMPIGSTPQFFNSTWDKIGKGLMESSGFGEQISGNGFLDAKVNELIADKNSPVEKMSAIFDFVSSNYRWNDVYGITTEYGIRKTFNDKTGNVADINLLLVSMLQKAGLNANPIVLSSVSNGMLDYSFPSRTKLNYVIVAVEDSKGYYLMDATSPVSRINLLPTRALNYRGILISKNGTKEIPLTNEVMSNDKISIEASLDPSGSFKGKYTDTRDNYFYLADAPFYASSPKEFEEYYTEDYNLDYDDFKVQDNNQGSIRHSFTFSDVNADNISGKLMFNPMLFLVETDSKLYYDTRNYPLEFGGPSTTTKTIKIKIPDGYKVESLPQQSSFEVQDKTAAFGYAVVEKDGYIIAQSQEIIPYSILPQTYYKPFKEYKNKIIQANQQQVVLVKQ